MKTILIALLACLATINLQAEEAFYEVDPFYRLKINGAIKVQLVKGDSPMVTMSSHEKKDFRKIDIESNGKQLTISLNGTLKGEVLVIVSYQQLERISQLGGSLLEAKGVIESKRFKYKADDASMGEFDVAALDVDINIRRTSKAKIKVEAKSLSVEIREGSANLNVTVDSISIKQKGEHPSEITIIGTTNSLKAKINKSAELNAAELKAKSVELNVSNYSVAAVFASESISGNVTPDSELKLYGNPTTNKLTNVNLETLEEIEIGMQKEIERENTPDDILVDIEIDFGNDFKIEIANEIEKEILIEIQKEANNEDLPVGDTVHLRAGPYHVMVVKPNEIFNDSKEEEEEETEGAFKLRRFKNRHNYIAKSWTWSSLDIGTTGLVNEYQGFTLSKDYANYDIQSANEFMTVDYAKSYTIAASHYKVLICTRGSRLTLVSGVGLERNSIDLKNNVQLRGQYNTPEGMENYTWGETDTINAFTRNRLNVTYLNLPLLFNLNLGGSANAPDFYLLVGATAGLRIGTRMKYKYDDNGDKVKYKEKNDFNVNPFKLNLTARIGIKDVELFANYSLTSLFEKNGGPELYSFSAGLSITSF
ncbi:MAG: DUF2807 domain-containing protein [Flavobacteriales bacterium]|nr:DUF2807 domain-containing protein [Flavobacteriales bacterium]